MIRHRLGCLASLVATVLAPVSSAFAADALRETSVSAAPEPLDEVIVHARRRDERLEDAPLAVTVRSGEQLRAESAVLFDDIARDVPNVRMVSSPQSVSALDVTMRGQTVNRSAIVFDSAVGLYVDGVYVANGQGAMGTLLDVDSVEVVRGSQGTLFGRNNTGGSISFRTRRPELDHTSAEVALAGGDYGMFRGRGILNVPVSDTVAVRLAYQDDSRRGFGSSLASGQDNLENRHRFQARLGALWKPDENSDAYFTYEHFEANENGAILHPLAGTLIGQLGQLLASFPFLGVPAVAFPADPYLTDGSFHSLDHARTDALQLTVSRRFAGGLAAKLILGYRALDATAALDVDASPLPLADSTLINTSHQKSAELQFSDQAFAGRLDWVAGLYWFHDQGGAPSVQSPASPEFLAALSAINQASGGQLDLSPIFSAVPVYEQNTVVNHSEAVFVHGEYQLTPDWAIAAGVRRTDDRRELQENSFVIVPGSGESCTILDISLPPPYQVAGACPDKSNTVSYGFWSWEFSARHRLNDAWNTYTRIGRSQRSGGWNAPLSTLQDAPFRPEQLTDYELGLKANLLGGALAISGDVFYGRYNDMQRLLAQSTPTGTPATLVVNAGRARISGAELELLFRPSRQATLQASAGWTDARYLEFQYSPGIGLPAQDLSSNAFYQTPRVQASLGASYRIPTGPGDLWLRADYAWQDKIQFNVINDFNAQNAYGTLNARLALQSYVKTWELALFGSNLRDTRYVYTGGTILAPQLPPPSAAIAWQVPGDRRTVGVELTYHWNSNP
jgi:iron complex outermembrane receptor protein